MARPSHTIGSVVSAPNTDSEQSRDNVCGQKDNQGNRSLNRVSPSLLIAWIDGRWGESALGWRQTRRPSVRSPSRFAVETCLPGLPAV
jgi:hypothetical protein